MNRSIQGARIVVTGGAGFIGSHLVDALLDGGAEQVAVVDTFFLGKEVNLERSRQRHGDRLAVYREDAGDRDAMQAVCDAVRPDVVYNLATKALLYSFFNPVGACQVNLDIALSLCELARQKAFGRLVHVSSSEVYGTAQQVPMTEDHPLLAETTYAAGKAAADLAVASYVRMFDIDAVTVRPFNNYGPRQNEGTFAAVIPSTIRRILGGEAPLVEGDGEQTRDFILVDDTVDVLVRFADLPGIAGEVVNVGSGRETSIRSLVTTIAELLGYDGPIESRPPRPADVRRHRAGVDKLHTMLDFEPTPIERGLEPTVAWYRERLG